MLPFSKRPPPPEEYFLRSGDFEAVRQDSYSGPGPSPYASHAIPAAPRAPVFARQAAHTPYGFSQRQQNHYGDLSAPPPPHSLAPVAMGGYGADSTGRNFAQTTSRTNGTIVVREKPSLKWGVMIALSGALLGGVLGLGMDARRQNARAAAAAADARDNAPPAILDPRVAAALPNANAANAANALGAAPRPATPPPPVAGNVIAPPAPVVLAPVAPVVVAPTAATSPIAAKAPEAVAPVKVAHAAPKAAAPKSHFLAAKVQTPAKPAPEKAEAPEPKTAKADPPEPKTKKKETASTSDAMKILEAANKDTTNTL